MSEKSYLLDGVIIDDDTYKMFNKVLDIDAKGHKKWKKYIKRKMKLYNRYMSKTFKGGEDMDLWTGGSESDYKFNKVSSDAAEKALIIKRAKAAAARRGREAVKRAVAKIPAKPIAKAKPTPPSSLSPLRPSDLTTIQDFRDQLERNRQEFEGLLPFDDDASRKRKDKILKVNRDLMREITRLLTEREEAEKNQEIIDNTATAPADASPVELRPSESQGAVEPNVISPPPPPEPVVREDDVEFGAKSGQDAMAFIERFKLKDRLITPNNIKEWFDETTGADFYDATLYYKTVGGEVIQFVIACVEGPPDIIGNRSAETTMELIEIHNLNKREGGSIKPFVIKVLKDGKFSGVNMVYLSPADQGLQNDLYEDQWGLDCEKIDENYWCWAKKQDLIKSLARKFITIDSGFIDNKLTVGEKKYVKVMVGAQPNETRKDIADLLMKDNGEHVAKLYPLEFLKSRKVFSLNGQFIKMKIGAKGIEGDDDNIYVSEYAGEPIIYNKPSFDDLLEQTTSGLAALHREGIIHGDIRKENIVYDREKITIVSFDRAILKTDKVDNPITENNIWPPKTYIGDDNFKIDKWALALTLLDYNDKFNDDVQKLLFGNEGLMFVGGDIDNAAVITDKRKPVIEGNGLDDLLKYIFFIFAKDSDVSNTAAAMDSFLPGVLMPSSAPRERDINNQKGNDNTNWIDKMLNIARLGNSDADMAKNWVKGHKRLLETQTRVKSLKKKWYPPKVAKIKDPSLKRGYRKNGVSPNIDLGELLYGLTTKQVVKIFDMFASSGAVSVIRAPVRNSYLDYDSFSDTELNELEAELDMYTDDEFDRMMEGAVTGMGKDDLSYDSMSDSSLPSSNAISYNSSSDAAYSYDSSSDTGLSGLAASYNSESEQSYQNSEHDASYDSESDEDS
jgi:serine/threonine protein kinase